MLFGLLSVTHLVYGTKFDCYNFLQVNSSISVSTLKRLPDYAGTCFDIRDSVKSQWMRQYLNKSRSRHLLIKKIVPKRYQLEKFEPR